MKLAATIKILIVDDKEENLFASKLMLEREGYEVIQATNGVEALEKVKSEHPDMIISDIFMPKMDGFQLCREVKGNEKLRKIPFIFYTATYTDQKDKEFALSLGAERFILKPAEPEEFIATLQAVLKNYQAGTLVPKEAPPPEEKVYLKEYNERLVNKLEARSQQLEVANKELEEKVVTLEKFKSVTEGREIKMFELKRRIEELENKLALLKK